MRSTHTLVTILILTTCLTLVHAGVTVEGDTDPLPTDAFWSTGGDSETRVKIGDTAYGSLVVDGGSDLSLHYTRIGYDYGAIGEVTVDGEGTTLTDSYEFYVGLYGQGTLNVTNGGGVLSRSGAVGSGLAVIDGPGSTWMVEATNTVQGTLGVAGFASGDLGTLRITAGGQVSCRAGSVGGLMGGEGEVIVDGEGSVWTNDVLSVGRGAGDGSVYITNGGSVVANAETWVGYAVENASGTIHFDNGTLTTGTLACVPSDITGTGTIYAHGIIADTELVFDSSYGATQTLLFDDEPNQNVVVNLDVNGEHSLGVGYRETGSMSITEGIALTSHAGHLGSQFGSSGTALIEGAGSAWVASEHHVGHQGDGTLRIAGGAEARTTDYAYVGYGREAGGQVIVEGLGSSWTTRQLYLGESGQGELRITGGATVSTADLTYVAYEDGSTGLVTVDGPGATWTNGFVLTVGHKGDGVLNITNGGVVSGSYYTHVGASSGASGTVLVDGDGSRWTTMGSVDVGRAGKGSVMVSNSGDIQTGGVSLGTYGSEGVVVIDGGGSIWTASGTFSVQPRTGESALTVRSGGRLNSGSGYIAADLGFHTPAVVDGVGSTWANTGSMVVTCSDGWGLVVTDGGKVSSADGTVGISQPISSKVLIAGNESAWTNNQDLLIGYTQFSDSSGFVNILDGGMVTVGGTLRIDKERDGDSFVSIGSGGMLALHGEADASIEEFYSLIDGPRAIRYWDNISDSWTSIDNGVAGLDFALQYNREGELAGYTLLTVNAVAPVAWTGGDITGDAVTNADDIALLAAAIQAGSSDTGYDTDGDGDVDNDDLTFLIENLVHTSMSTYDEGTRTWSNLGTALGDFNLDGEVGILDLGALGDAYGTSGGWALGDANGDGMISILDLGTLGDNYGYDRSAIPEPASALMLLTGALMVLKRNRR
jgi:T5SS/PEP-CTERM-associated repeat protein